MFRSLKFLTATGVAAVGGASLLTSNPVHAEATPSLTDRLGPYKKPIYDTPSTTTTLESIPPSPLEVHIRLARKKVSEEYFAARAHLHSAVNSWIGYEKAVESTLREVAPRNEELLPGAIYVIVSGMAGSIVARNRIWPLRMFTSALFFVGGAHYFLPETAQNVSELAWRYEQRTVPQVAKVHAEVREKVETAIHNVEEGVERAEKAVTEGVEKGKEYAKEHLEQK
ncbi:hypothetical protein YB2330_006159 [Saitoella coloradoensis]